MNWRWLILDFVDPQLNLTIEQRRSVRRQAKYLRELGRYANDSTAAWFRVLPPRRMPLLNYFLNGLFIFYFFVVMLQRVRWEYFLFMVGIVIAGWVIYVLIEERRTRTLTLAALCYHGFDVCRNCGYLLQGLRDDASICPECGAQSMPLPEQIDLPDEHQDLLDKL